MQTIYRANGAGSAGRQGATALTRRTPVAAAAAKPRYEASIWLGLMAPAATPPAIVERLNAEVNRIMGLPATREAQLRMGALLEQMPVAAFDAHLRRDITRQADAIRVARTQPN